MKQTTALRLEGGLCRALVLSLLAIIVVSALATAGCSDEGRQKTSYFPRRLPETLLLPAAGTGIVRGIDRYAGDGSKERFLEYEDGAAQHTSFRLDGTISQDRRYFPHEGGPAEPVLKSHATFDLDGKTYKSHEVFRQDGTLARAGKLLKDGRYETSYFFEDGKTAERVRIFSRGKKEFVNENLFRRDGSLKASISAADMGELYVTLYSEDGTKRTAAFYKGVTGEHGSVYAEDGETILVQFEHDYWTRTEVYYRKDGVMVQKRFASGGAMRISFLSSDGRTIYKQTWRLATGKHRQMLREVEELDFADKKLVRTIRMTKDGRRVDRVTYADGKARGPGDAAVSREALREPAPTAELPTFPFTTAPPLIYDYE